MRSRYTITSKDGVYFVTSTIVEWLPVFTSQRYFDIVIQSLQFCKDHNQFAYYKKQFKTKSTYQVWQEASHPQLIIDEEMLVQKIEYIHYNPVKRGLVDLPEHWRYSSARNYRHNDQSLISVDRLPN